VALKEKATVADVGGQNREKEMDTRMKKRYKAGKRLAQKKKGGLWKRG